MAIGTLAGRVAECHNEVPDCEQCEHGADDDEKKMAHEASRLISVFAVMAFLDRDRITSSCRHVNPLFDVHQVSHDCKCHHHQQ